MSNIDLKIEALFELAEESSNIPFTNSIKVDKDELFRVLAEIKESVPDEIEEAKRIVRDCERYIENAKSEAESIIKQAEFEASKLVSDHEIYLEAVEEGRRIIDESNDEADRGFLEVTKYLDDLLESSGNAAEDARAIMEQQQAIITEKFNETADIILQIREQLRNGNDN